MELSVALFRGTNIMLCFYSVLFFLSYLLSFSLPLHLNSGRTRIMLLVSTATRYPQSKRQREKERETFKKRDMKRRANDFVVPVEFVSVLLLFCTNQALHRTIQTLFTLSIAFPIVPLYTR